MHNILLKIIEKKKEDIKRFRIMKHESGSKEKKIMIHDSSFMILGDKVAIIAEIKFASPTNPHLGSAEELLKRARQYEDGGADAISIITEPHFFKGDTSFITKVKKTVSLPILQKDFVIDEKQIYQAKEIGSDALLLIARLIDKKTLQNFVKLCFALNIESVVEVNNEKDLEKAITTDTNIIAVNARNLETFEVDVNKACKLIKIIPDKFIKLGFSGINSANEVEKYKLAGAKGVLVGTSLMTTKDIHRFIADLRETNISEHQSTIRENHKKVKVKICGIRSLESARVAIAAGADFLGFNFVPTSKRFIDPKDAKKIINELRIMNYESRTQFVGVFQNQSINEVNKIAEELDLNFVQLHGEEDEEYIKQINKKIIKKTVILSETKDPDTNKDSSALPQNDNIAFFLLDRKVQGQGKMVDLKKAKKICREFPTFFSGGLTPENVLDVARKVKPFAVDVAGGIEVGGKQDTEKIELFVKNAKEVNL